MASRLLGCHGAFRLALLISASSLSGGIALAQERETGAATPEAGDIIVTATRRSESLNKVPLSIVASSQEVLDKQGVRNITDIARLTPSLTFTPDALLPWYSDLTIRGIQSNSGIPTTGIYIDDTPVQTRTGTSPDLTNPYPQVFDLDRVEVLRGPQGTLFGTGSVGGAVRFITPEPSLKGTSLYGRAEIASTEKGALSYEAGAAGGAPIIEDKLGFRLSVWHRRDGGYIDRLDRTTRELVDKDTNYNDAYTARLAIGWQPSENLTITPSLFFQDTYSQDQGIYEKSYSNPSKAQFRNGINADRQYYKDRFYLPAVKASLDLGKVTLLSNTSYLIRNTSTLTDDASGSATIFINYDLPFPESLSDYHSNTHYQTSQRVFTQELRLQSNDPSARFTWLIGAFYSHSRIHDTFETYEPDLLSLLNFGQSLAGQPDFASLAEIFGTELINGVSSSYSRTVYKDVQKSVFAQIDYKLTNKLKATLGARYTDTQVGFDNYIAGPFFGTTGAPTVFNAGVKPITPKVGLSYQADRNNLFYANVAKGARAPGVATALPGCPDAGTAIGFDSDNPHVVGSDSVWSYEIGSKNRLFDGRATIDASAFRIDWKNVQTTFQPPNCGQATTLNLGDARSQGFDVALALLPVEGLNLSASVSYTDAHYTTDVVRKDTGEVIRKSGEPLAVPPWSTHFSAEYEFPVGSRRLYVRGDYAYTSHNGTPVDVDSPLVDPGIPRRAATHNLDLRAGARFSGIDVSIFANNALNNHPILAVSRGFVGSTHYNAVTSRPRTIGLTATVRR